MVALVVAWVRQDAIPSYICVNPCYLWETLLYKKVLCITYPLLVTTTCNLHGVRWFTINNPDGFKVALSVDATCAFDDDWDVGV